MEAINNRLLIFYNRLKSVQPNLQSFEDAGYDEKSALTLYRIFNVEYKDDVASFGKDLFDSFFNSFNVKGFCPSNWHFKNSENHKIVDEKVIFGFSDTNSLVLNRLTNEILLIDSYNGNEPLPLASNFNDFLDVLLIEVEYDKIGYLNMEFTEDMRSEYKEKLFRVLVDNRYLSSYFDDLTL